MLPYETLASTQFPSFFQVFPYQRGEQRDFDAVMGGSTEAHLLLWFDTHRLREKQIGNKIKNPRQQPINVRSLRCALASQPIRTNRVSIFENVCGRRAVTTGCTKSETEQCQTSSRTLDRPNAR